MQFIFDGEMYKIVRITGPMHNMLGLSFTENNSTNKTIKIIALKTQNDEISNISASDVKKEVSFAIDEINSKFGVNYKVNKIQFIPSDTPQTNIYKDLAMALIKRIITKGKFELIPRPHN